MKFHKILVVPCGRSCSQVFAIASEVKASAKYVNTVLLCPATWSLRLPSTPFQQSATTQSNDCQTSINSLYGGQHRRSQTGQSLGIRPPATASCSHTRRSSSDQVEQPCLHRQQHNWHEERGILRNILHCALCNNLHCVPCSILHCVLCNILHCVRTEAFKCRRKNRCWSQWD